MNHHSEDIFDFNFSDILNVIKRLYKYKRNLTLSFILFGLIGILHSFVLPEIFTASTSFIPQLEASSKTSSIQGIASLAGINLGSSSVNSKISPSLYPSIVNSTPFKLKLLKSYVNYDERTITIFQYLQIANRNRFSQFFSNELNHEIEDKKKHSIEESSEEMINDALNKISDRLSIEIENDTGIIKLSYSDGNRFIASQVADISLQILKDNISEYGNNSARSTLLHTEKEYNKQKLVYENLQDSIAIFIDSNLNISSSLFQNKLDRLKMEMNIRLSIVQQLASQVEQAKLLVVMETPAFTIIEPVKTPHSRSSPKRKKIVLIWILLGSLSTIFYYLLIEPVQKVILSIRD